MANTLHFIPKRITLGVRQGLTAPPMHALGLAADQAGVEDRRLMAARLIIEGLIRRGLLPSAYHEMPDSTTNCEESV